MKKLPPRTSESPLPGEASDDVDRLKMLWLRARDLDQAAESYEVVFAAEKGGGWSLTVRGPGGQRESLGVGYCATALLREEVAKLSRALALRARSDFACLQLCGVPFEPFDAPGEGAVEPTAGREDPAHEYFVVRFVEKKDYRSGRGPHPEVTPELRYARRWRTRECAARDEAVLTPPGAFAVVPARKGVDYVYPPVGEETRTVVLSASIVAVP